MSFALLIRSGLLRKAYLHRWCLINVLTFSNERGVAPSEWEELDRNTRLLILEAKIIDRCKIRTKTKRFLLFFQLPWTIEWYYRVACVQPPHSLWDKFRKGHAKYAVAKVQRFNAVPVQSRAQGHLGSCQRNAHQLNRYFMYDNYYVPNILCPILYIHIMSYTLHIISYTHI